MYEVLVRYLNTDAASEDTILCESKPSLEFDGDFLLLNCGKGQSLTLSRDCLFKVTIKYPLPDRMPAFKYKIDIHYDTKAEDVELLCSPYNISTDVKNGVVILKEGDNIVRVINGKALRNIKVSSYTEGNL